MPGDFYHTFCYDACAHVVPKDYAHIATQSAADKLTNYYVILQIVAHGV